MISFHSGIQALRKFKVNSLNQRIKALIPDLELTGTEYIHFIESEKNLSQSNKKILHKLLNYSPKVNLKNSKYKVTIIPRIGTISPWSSKASDICKICGLSVISRVERGINYHFDRTINANELVTILELVMDKMTESHLNNINDSDLLSLPFRIVVSKRNLDNGVLELYDRDNDETLTLTQDQILEFFKNIKI